MRHATLHDFVEMVNGWYFSREGHQYGSSYFIFSFMQQFCDASKLPQFSSFNGQNRFYMDYLLTEVVSYDKPLSPVLQRYYDSHIDSKPSVSEFESWLEHLSHVILVSYESKWSHIISAMQISYTPTHNYDMSEEGSDTSSKTTTPNLTTKTTNTTTPELTTTTTNTTTPDLTTTTKTTTTPNLTTTTDKTTTPNLTTKTTTTTTPKLTTTTTKETLPDLTTTTKNTTTPNLTTSTSTKTTPNLSTTTDRTTTPNLTTTTSDVTKEATNVRTTTESNNGVFGFNSSSSSPESAQAGTSVVEGTADGNVKDEQITAKQTGTTKETGNTTQTGTNEEDTSVKQSGTTTEEGSTTQSGRTTETGSTHQTGTSTEEGTSTQTGTTTESGSTKQSGTSTDEGKTTQTGTTTDNGTITQTGTSKDEGTKTETGNTQESIDTNHHFSREGNIGVTTTQQMLTEELELRKNRVADIIIEDVSRVLCMRIYQ